MRPEKIEAKKMRLIGIGAKFFEAKIMQLPITVITVGGVGVLIYQSRS